MMETVTADDGTGMKARVPGFRVAGKTGTAQKVDPVTGGYSADKRVASFVGFVPAEAPRLVVMVMIDEPRGQVYGGLVAAPVFSRISTQALQYLKVMPNQPLSPGETLPSMEEILAQAKKEKEAAAKLESEAVAETPEKESEPQEIEDVLAAADTDVPAAPVGPQMPDFKGMSYRQVVEVMQSRGINVSLRGHGRVIEQSPGPGSAIPYGATIWVRLAPPGQADAGGGREPRG
jgi:cell division protein FtsI (penicillin-binding protein 3)